MSIRLFEWRDLPSLHRCRSECLFLDSTLVLTNGTIFAPTGALLSFISPAAGIFTYLIQNGGKPVLFGQVAHLAGSVSGRLLFLTPQTALENEELQALLDQLSAQVIERGGMYLLAEVDEQTRAFDLLRQAGFGVYARQRIWKLPESQAAKTLPGLRRASQKLDQTSVRFLYANLVPALVQQVEPFATGHLRGMVYYRGSELLAYIEIKHGMQGIWVQPFVHPDAEAIAEALFQVLQALPSRRGRPVYVCVRSYQYWLEPVLEQLQALPGPRQGMLVRHLARRVAPAFQASAAMNGKTTEPTLPVANSR